MALTNAQYDEIMRGYDKRQLHNKYIHDKRIEDAYRKAPRLREIDSEIASASVRQAYRLMDGDENALASLRLAIEDFEVEEENVEADREGHFKDLEKFIGVSMKKTAHVMVSKMLNSINK